MTLYLGDNLISGVTTVVDKTDRVGQIIQSTIPLTDAGLHLLDGSLINGSGAYSSFVDYIANVYSNEDTLYAFYCPNVPNYYTKTQAPVVGDKVYNKKGQEVGILQSSASSYPSFVWLDSTTFLYMESSTVSYGYTRESTYDTVTGVFCSETEWQETVTTYGTCGYYVYNSTNNTVRLPRIEGFTESTINPTNLGDLTEAGLPNIEGELRLGHLKYLSSSGSFAKSYETTKASNFGTEGSSKEADCIFDASDSNPIYGNSTTVQPQSIKVLYYVVIANSVKTEIETDIDNVMTDLNSKADVDLTNLVFTASTNFDGQVHASYLEVYNGSLGSNGSTTVNISSYLPNDNYSYLVGVEGVVTTGSSSGNSCNCKVVTDLLPTEGYTIVGIRTRSASTMYNNGAALIPIGTTRSITIINNGNASGTVIVRFHYYRRIGTNS